MDTRTQLIDDLTNTLSQECHLLEINRFADEAEKAVSSGYIASIKAKIAELKATL